MWTARPWPASLRANARATGVLPEPPSVRLPTQITGGPGSNGRPRARRAAVAAAQIHETGRKSARVSGAGAPRRTYHQRGVASLTGPAAAVAAAAAGSAPAPRRAG